MTTKYSKDAFVGTAQYYVRYRVPYPQCLIDDLIARTRIAEGSRLLDLGCGPGRVALALAPSFREVLAVDLEPEMIEVGKEEAKKLNIINVKWVVGMSEEINTPLASFQMITIGEAFHRLDQDQITTKAFDWLSPNGYLVIMGGHFITRGSEKWKGVLNEVIQKWTRPSAKIDDDKEKQNETVKQKNFQEILQTTRFENVTGYHFPHPYVWTVDSIIGYLYSTSVCSKMVLGERAEAFESELKSTLLALDSSGQYSDVMDFQYILARRP